VRLHRATAWEARASSFAAAAASSANAGSVASRSARRAHAFEERAAVVREPAVVGVLVDERRLPEAPVVRARHPGAEVVAAGTGGLDLGLRERLVVHRHRVEQRTRVPGHLVAEHEALEGALEAGLEVADVVQERRPRQGSQARRDAELQ
jgi:hypothetical protein